MRELKLTQKTSDLITVDEIDFTKHLVVTIDEDGNSILRKVKNEVYKIVEVFEDGNTEFWYSLGDFFAEKTSDKKVEVKIFEL